MKELESKIKIHNLNEFIGGWVVGNFSPTLHRNADFEVSVKRFEKGQKELSHKQLVATEISIVVEGTISLGNKILEKNEIGIIDPQEFASFESLTDSIIVCIKFPSEPSDKVFEN
jgi:hypothetical protein